MQRTTTFRKFARPLAAVFLCLPLLSQAHSPAPDESGEPKTGLASYYGPEFFGRPMADGAPFDPESNYAASRTLPLGTRAKVTNLENGKSEEVVIRDRGPYIDGRIIDLSPRTARQLDMLEQGVVEVEVIPLELPGQEENTVARND